METTLLVPFLPETAPFSGPQRAWLNGFLAGLFSSALPEAQVSASAAAPAAPLGVTILYGTQTGTAEALARKTATKARQRGFVPELVDLSAYDPSQLPHEQHVLILTSTHGDGDVPDAAQRFWTALSGPTAPRLEGVSFSVLGLGDSAYARFCAAGIVMDARLAELGAHRIHPRVDCDVDFDEPFEAWVDGVLTSLAASNAGAGAAAPDHRRGDGLAHRGDGSELPSPSVSVAEPAADEPGTYSRAHPLAAPMITRTPLNGVGSVRETHHVVIATADSALHYEAGDALGVLPQNCSELVNDVLHALRASGEEPVTVPGCGELALRDALVGRLELGRIHRPLLSTFASRAGSDSLAAQLVADAAACERYLAENDVLDLIRDHPLLRWDPPALVAQLRRLQPRLYSIASGPSRHPGEVHLTVGAVRFAAGGRKRKGVCSTFLADRVAAGATVPVYVHPNPHFRLPVDGDTPLVMIGPGTGIAPFRAFLQERQATGARGKNWLFFGAPNRETDFLYRSEMEALVSDGVLTRLDTAFSRDQAAKRYVQHRMLEASHELYGWLEAGASLYVCGDASRMAKDVDRALHEVIERNGHTTEAATAYVDRLRAEGRYRRDVY